MVNTRRRLSKYEITAKKKDEKQSTIAAPMPILNRSM
jgi:hypothetical protein